MPEGFFSGGEFDRLTFVSSRRQSLSFSANPLAVGPHVIPDQQRPADIGSRCPILAEFLSRLETIVSIANTITS